MPLSTLQVTPRDVPSKTRGQDGFATSFPVGLLHPLQHAGLTRRTPSCPSSAHREAPPRLDSSTWVHSLGVVIRAAARQWGPRAWLDAPGCSWLEAPRKAFKCKRSQICE